MHPTAPRDRPWDGAPDFDARLLPRLEAIPCFRRAPDEEVRASYADYARGDAPALLATWRTRCEPTRATLDGIGARFYLSLIHI